MAKKKLLGVKILEHKITAMLKGFGIDKAELGTNYLYWRDTGTGARVTFKVTADEDDLLFNQFIAERFGDIIEVENTTIFMFVTSLLHEVGHHMTDDLLDEDDYEKCEKEVDKIESILTDESIELSPQKYKEYQFRYFNVKNELMATTWAVEYIQEHPFMVSQMIKESEKALQEFYSVNNVKA